MKTDREDSTEAGHLFCIVMVATASLLQTPSTRHDLHREPGGVPENHSAPFATTLPPPKTIQEKKTENSPLAGLKVWDLGHSQTGRWVSRALLSGNQRFTTYIAKEKILISLEKKKKSATNIQSPLQACQNLQATEHQTLGPEASHGAHGRSEPTWGCGISGVGAGLGMTFDGGRTTRHIFIIFFSFFFWFQPICGRQFAPYSYIYYVTCPGHSGDSP